MSKEKEISQKKEEPFFTFWKYVNKEDKRFRANFCAGNRFTANLEAAISDWWRIHLSINPTSEEDGVVIALNLFMLHLYIGVYFRPLNQFLSKYVSYFPRETGFTIRNDGFHLMLWYVDNDWSSKRSWLERKNISLMNHNKWWVNLIDKYHSGFHWNFYWVESTIGYKYLVEDKTEWLYTPSNVIFNYVDKDGNKYYGTFKASLEKNTYDYQKKLGKYLTKVFDLSEEHYRLEVELVPDEEHKLPMRNGKGENSWDCDNEPCIGDMSLNVELSQICYVESGSVSFNTWVNVLLIKEVERSWERYGKA